MLTVSVLLSKSRRCLQRRDCTGGHRFALKVSWADLTWYNFIAAPKGFFDNAEGAKAAYEACPRIKAAMEAVAEIPELQEWIQKRPDSMF